MFVTSSKWCVATCTCTFECINATVILKPSLWPTVGNPVPNDMNDTPNITFTDVYFANNLTLYWAEAYSTWHSCFNENNITSTPGTSGMSL